MSVLRAVVVGYSPTERSELALDRALAEALRDGARLVVVNATPGDRYADTSFATREQITHIEDRLRASGVEHEVRQPVRGRDAAAEILTAAEEVEADLIVIGIRHRSAVGKLLLGSTAQRVILEADCPVLSVKA